MALIKSKQQIKAYSQARLSRDARFDGVFFTAVKTTRIYCRSICPASPPLEKNVEYHDSAISAAKANFRPCLRCHPDSAPESNLWQGTGTTFQRALNLINAGALQSDSLEDLSERLGITSRYLRELFQKNLGVSPKQYTTYKQCLFAKKLLHETDLSITTIAFASGFSSIRQFNTSIKDKLKLTPSQMRKLYRKKQTISSSSIKISMSYRPPYAWEQMLRFLEERTIPGLEWIDNNMYGRVFEFEQTHGYFEIGLGEKKNSLNVEIMVGDSTKLFSITQKIRTLFDVDSPILNIDKQLQNLFGNTLSYLPGLRLPGVWSAYEAGVRAILGQQVSVKQAHTLVAVLVENLGEPVNFSKTKAKYFFPKPEIIAQDGLDFFRMPQARKDTLRRFSQYMIENSKMDNSSEDIDKWLSLKGIGPWTVNYVKLRAAKDPDVWLSGDAGVKNALKKIKQDHPNKDIDINAASPWRSYLVFHLWNQL